jgi:hypothetical protein
MDYGAIIREAWRTTWRYRFLWALGIFAGGAAGLPTGGGNRAQWQVGRDDWAQAPPEMQRLVGNTINWFVDNIAVVATVAAIALLIGLALLVLWLIAQGGMAEATVDLARGDSTSLGRAWDTGVHLFWRYAGLWSVLFVAAMLIALVVGAAVALLIAVGNVAGAVVFLMPVAVLLAIALAIVGIVVAIGASIVVSFAQRAIFAENVGPLDALRIGWNMVSSHLGVSLLVWLINVALAIGVALATGLIAAVVAGVLAVPAVALWAATGFTTATVAYLALGVIVVLAAVLVLVGIANTFFWNYWTLAYLRLSRA